MERIRNRAGDPGAFIIDGHGRSELGVIRALGERGVPVYLATDCPASPTAASRYVTRVLPLPAHEAEETLVTALLRIGRRFDHRPVFFSTGDTSLVTFSRHRERLSRYFRHHLSSAELIEDLYDKSRFAQRALAVGLPVPTTLVPRNAAELEAGIGRLRFPVMVKPAEKRRWSPYPEIHALTGGNLKGLRVDTAEALRMVCRRLLRYDAITVIQDYVEGRDEALYSMHLYVDREGDLVGAFTGQKLRTYPIHRGVGCFQTSVYEPEVIELGKRVMRALDYRGHAIVNVKRCPDEEGRFHLLEINCRYSTWNYLHTFAGVNLPYAAYRDSLGEKQRPLPRQRCGMRWIDAANDLRALPEYLRVGEWNVARWMASYAGRNCYAVFRWRDPRPFFTPFLARLWRVLRWRPAPREVPQGDVSPEMRG